MRLRSDLICRACRLALALGLALAWSGWPQYLLAQTANARPPSRQDVERLIAQARQTFAAIEAADKQLPRDSFEPGAIVQKVGADPQKLFEWVRDRTGWAPYRGALRGPSGVLMDRLGSSLDRALLLAELLRNAGQTVRLAHADLTDEQARSLLPKVRPIPEQRFPRSAAPADAADAGSHTAKIAKDYQLDAARLAALDQAVSLERDKFAENLVQRVADQSALLLKAVGKPTAEQLKAQHDRDESKRVESLRDHWWVQRQDAGAWIDLDPLLADGQPGQTVTAPTQTFTADGATGKFALDRAVCHEIVLSVVIEQSTKTARAQKTVLTQALRPGEVLGQPIVLRQRPMHWPSNLSLVEEKQPVEKLKATVSAQDEWLPVLSVGSNNIIQSSFNDKGEVEANGEARLQSILDGAVAGKRVGNILGSGRIGQVGAGRDTEQTPGVLTAEWIDYEVHVPGRANQTIRRQVFDLIGPAARAADPDAKQPPSQPDDLARLVRGFAAMGEVQMLPLASHFSEAFVEHLANENLLADKEMLLQPPAVKTQQEFLRSIQNRLSRGHSFFAPLYMWTVARQQYSRFDNDIYLDAPNLITFHTDIQPDTAGRLLQSRAFDIVANVVAVRAGCATDPFTVRLTQGVLDTNVEDLLLASAARPRNAAELYSTAVAGEAWLAARSADDEKWKSIAVPGNVRSRMSQDLSAGYVVVAPTRLATLQKQPAYGWWRVDASTGSCLGIGPRGWGSSSVEYFIAIALAVIFIEACVCAVENMSDEQTAAQRAKMFTCILSAAFCEIALMIAIFMIVNPEFMIPATYYLVAEESGAILATTVVMEESAIPVIGHVSAEACGLGLAVQSLASTAFGGGEGNHSEGAGHGETGAGTSGGGDEHAPEGGATSGTGGTGSTGNTGGGSADHGRVPPPLEDDPHLPGKRLPPWHDLG